MSNKLFIAILLIGFSLIGFIIFIAVTTHGIGIGTDSLTYFSVARNLLAGKGFMVTGEGGAIYPLTNFPPFYPIVLSIIGYTGVDIIKCARYLNAILFSINILLVCYVIYIYSNNSIWLAILAFIITLTSSTVLNIYTMALSEPLFILLAFCGILLLTPNIESPNYYVIFCVSILFSLAFMTRYAGIVFIVSGAMGVWLLAKEPILKRIIHSSLVFTISCIPMTLWLFRNLYYYKNATNREIAFHSISLGHLKKAFYTISLWIVPSAPEMYSGKHRLLILIIILVYLILLAIYYYYKGINTSASHYQEGNKFAHLPTFMGILTVIYIIFIILCMIIIEKNLFFDERILLPVYICLLYYFLCFISRVIAFAKEETVIYIAFITICFVFITLYITTGISWMLNNYDDGRGFASKTWMQSELIKKAESFPPGIKIYSNRGYLISFLCGKYTYTIPVKNDLSSGKINPEYYSRVDLIRGELNKGEAIIVYFNESGSPYYPSEKELRESLPLRMIIRTSDGAIYEGERKR